MLKLQDVSKTYANGVHALRGVSLEIPRGMFGLLGPNGAGKSTLMRTIATLQEPDSGSIHLDQLDVLADKAATRRVLGYLPQDFGLYPRASAEMLLDHFAVLKGLTRARERRDTVHHLLHLTNLWEARKQKLGTFSGGMRQRFGIAQALIGDPQLVIVDEPTAGLDPGERRRFLNLLSEIGANVVIILSTHIVEDVREICGHMAIIDHGTVRLTAAPRQAVEQFAGKIWEKRVERGDETEEDTKTLISKRVVSGQTVMRCVAEASPGAGFVAVEPDLEDVYFATLRQAEAEAEPVAT